MDMGKVLSNKIITITDTCAVWVNTFCWCDTVCIWWLPISGTVVVFLSEFSFVNTV